MICPGCDRQLGLKGDPPGVVVKELNVRVHRQESCLDAALGKFLAEQRLVPQEAPIAE